MKVQILLGGVGGQGLVSTGEILGQAASVFENINATLTAAYGSETRGTFTKADVIISDAMISYPNVDRPDVMLCLAQVAYDKYIDKFSDDTIIFYDSESVTQSPDAKGEHIGYPFRQMGVELGNPAVANSIAMGVMVKRCGFLKKDSVLKAMSEWFSSKPQVIEINHKAVEVGYSL